MEPDRYDTLQAKKHETHPILRQIIDRDCHVSLSYRAVIRHVISKLRDGYQTFRSQSKEERRSFVEQCIQIHQANRAEYEAVMWPRSSQPDPPEP